jgi:hypothetical protein
MQTAQYCDRWWAFVKPSVSINYREFLDEVRTGQFLRNDIAPLGKQSLIW